MACWGRWPQLFIQEGAGCRMWNTDESLIYGIIFIVKRICGSNQLLHQAELRQ